MSVRTKTCRAAGSYPAVVTSGSDWSPIRSEQRPSCFIDSIVIRPAPSIASAASSDAVKFSSPRSSIAAPFSGSVSRTG